MPNYEYRCGSCAHVFTLRQGFESEPVVGCPICGGGSRRQFAPVGVIYKGSGFYTTDYKRRGAGSGGDGASSGESRSSSGGEGSSNGSGGEGKGDGE